MSSATLGPCSPRTYESRPLATLCAEPEPMYAFRSGSRSIIRAVVSIAADRNMVTTAEGVETQQQREIVQALGCTQMQGYLFSAALPAHEIREMLALFRITVEDAA